MIKAPPIAEMLMFSMLSKLSLVSALPSLNLGSVSWKELLPAILQESSKNHFDLLQGIAKYINQPPPYIPSYGELIVERGSAKLYSFCSSGTPIIFIPSLINKPYILNLAPGYSLLSELAKLGIRPLILDWGTPNADEQHYSIADYYANILLPVVEQTLSKIPKPYIAGYCMGGFFATALAQNKGNSFKGLINLATPWDFHLPNTIRVNPSAILLQTPKNHPVNKELLKRMFYFNFAFENNQKFVGLANKSISINDFQLIENWVNDGVDMAYNTFKECVINIMQKNELCQNTFKIADTTISPRDIQIPKLSIISKKDKIAPMQSCLSLVEQLGDSSIKICDSGHIGMIINARHEVAKTIATWAKEHD